SDDELKDESDEEMFKDGKEMDEEFLQSANEETQPPHSESSSCFETFKLFDNYMSVTERVLVRNLQGFSESFSTPSISVPKPTFVFVPATVKGRGSSAHHATISIVKPSQLHGRKLK
nr:hypothetical protein [Tanacetum cinerariifolium]